MRPISFSILTSFLLVTVLAINDWSQPCFNGACEYFLPAHDTASGSLKIWGSANALSDITPAAGCEIIDCTPDTLTQEIRLVCFNNDTGSPDCDHLYQNDGAVGKVVRLPESCGYNAFAREHGILKTDILLAAVEEWRDEELVISGTTTELIYLYRYSSKFYYCSIIVAKWVM